MSVRISSAVLLAQVLDGGPAYEAGLRNGDRLLRVAGRDVAGWRTDPNGWMSDTSTFQQPPGTKVTVNVIRDTQPMEVTIVLKELLPIETTPASCPEDRASQSSRKTP
jgi:C-terminal processing protease CtpA/Prc